MEVADIARSMRARMPWPVGQLVLAESNVRRGQGWDKTVAKLSADPGLGGKADDLAVALREHLLCGEKSVSFLTLSQPNLTALRSSILQTTILPSLEAEIFPVLLDKDQLTATSPDLKLISRVETDNGIAAVFSSIRTIVTREELDRTEIPAAAADALADFDEIVGVKHTKVQAVDVLWIPAKGNLVDLRIDYPQGMYIEQASAAQQQLLKRLVSEFGLESPSVVNLFQLIGAIYNSPREGNVVELAFGTTTASLKHEKMRRSHLCLRDEAYHKAGKQALVGGIEPYRLSVRWRRAITEERFSQPELSLFSDTRIADGENPALFQAVIRKCASMDDFDFVRSRIEHYLTSAA